MSTYLKIVTGILVEPKVSPLYSWDVSFRISYMVVGLSINEFSEEFLRNLQFFFREQEIVLDKLGPIVMKK